MQRLTLHNIQILASSYLKDLRYLRMTQCAYFSCLSESAAALEKSFQGGRPMYGSSQNFWAYRHFKRVLLLNWWQYVTSMLLACYQHVASMFRACCQYAITSMLLVCCQHFQSMLRASQINQLLSGCLDCRVFSLSTLKTNQETFVFHILWYDSRNLG